jgi:hypothetical protein
MIAPSSLDLATLPSLPLSQRAKLPETAIDFVIAVCEELGHSLDKLTPVLTISPRL